MINERRSPMDLKDGLDHDDLDTYQPPRVLTRQTKIDPDEPMQSTSRINPNRGQQYNSQTNWLSKMSNSQQYLRHKLTQKIARLSSLESTRTSSSIELDNSEQNQQQQAQSSNQQQNNMMPLISITSNDSTTESNSLPESQRRQNAYRDYYGRTRFGVGNEDEDDDDDEDAFIDSPLPMPYSSSAMACSSVVRQQTDFTSRTYPQSGKTTRYEELLDDRQGMNDSEQQFTQGEKANRPSLDGSIISDLKDYNKRSIADKNGPGKKEKQHRSKSPSSSSGTNIKRNRQSKKGLLGFASRLKLTKKHESIAKFQLSILNSRLVSLKSLDKDLQSFLPRERLTVKQFEERVKLMRKFEVLSTIEYKFASRYETYVCKHAQRETNLPKNNYKRCIPYDYNRVVLKTLPSVPDSDYVNASHVDSCLKPNAYIAAQGPNENTIDDFWRMIWEQKTFVIVMLTKVFDFIRVMCNQYWPVELNKPERYGNLEVTLLYEEPLADFVIRTIKLTKLRGNPVLETEKDATDHEAEAQTNATNKEQQAREDLSPHSGDDDDIDSEDDTSGSEELILTTGKRELGKTSNNLSIRAPKFQTSKLSSTRQPRGRSLSPQAIGRDLSGQVRDDNPCLSDKLEIVTEAARLSRSELDLGQRDSMPSNQKRPNEFLHPLFSAKQLANSSASITSEPNTPMTPRTPSSAGLDRSSATRKVVKKKRRARVKNQRPRRTQFMVPSESQLLEDEDDDALGGLGDGTTTTGGRSNERIIYQFHYNSWASHTCPFISSLLHFRRRVRICMDEMAKSGKTGPTVVHCNDGCGRTGTYLCIDANLELVEEDNIIDVYNYAKKMRQSRKLLIENLSQYKFVYDTIDEAIFCGKTWFPVSELHKRLKYKSQRNPITKKNEYLREYEKICQLTTKFSIGDCAGGHRVENREKNRDVSIVPPDNFRPYLTSFQTNDSTDFINAVFVDGYTRSKEYIVTEWPLHRTISDFWSLVYDHDCNSVILLANPVESSTYPSFLPSEKELRRKFGPVFSAEMVQYTHYQNIKSWIYTINKKIVSLTEVIAGVKSEAKTTQVFQITCWPQGHRVPTSTNALVELMNMVERWRQRTTYGPVCVVSLNGKSRAGVYCAANVAIEQVVQHSEVDVFQAVKTVRRHRPQLIENMTEYKYCYDLILHYVLHYVNDQSGTN